MRALIVEDDPISGKMLQKILSAYGRCDLAFNGRQALEVFRRSLSAATPYNLICLDIMMPELSGQQTLRRIREEERLACVPAAKAVKVIMTTAVNETKEAAEALFNGGACAYFVKPIQIDNFIHELKSIQVIPA